MACIVGLDDLSNSLIDVGTNLLKSHSSIHNLLTLLDETERLLRNVGQDQPLSMQNALVPIKTGLVSVNLSNHPDSDVRVSVVSCLHEIMRITAPEAPYRDDQMREVFRLTIEAFDKLADKSSRSYKKAEAVLDNVSKVKSCIVMLDLECNDLIQEMFRNFFRIIRSDHPNGVFSSMEMILITIIDETDEVSKELLDILLANVRKENQNVSRSLAEKVLSRCARKLQPYIIKALNSGKTDVDMYSPVVLSISQIVFETPKVQNVVNNNENEEAEANLEKQAAPGDSDSSEEKMELRQTKRPVRDGARRANESDKARNGTRSAEAETESGVIGKRGRKPNSLMEDYEVSWFTGRRESLKPSSSKRIKKKGSKKAAPLPKETSSATSRSLTGSLKRSRVKVDESDLDSDAPSSPRLKKLALCVRDEVPPEEESDQESFEQLEAERNVGSPSRKTRSQNGSEKSQETVKKQPDVEVNSVGKRSSARTEAKRKNLKSASLDTTPVPQTSKSKRKVSEVVAKKETPKSQPTRRQTAKKEVESDKKVSGKDLVGKRVNIWWPLDKTYYEGIVGSYCSRKRTHRILYNDGEAEKLNLSKERWELLEDLSSANEEMEIDLPESIPLSDFIQRKKSKKNKNAVVSAEPTGSSGVRSSSRTSVKKNSGRKLNTPVRRGKAVSKADSVSEEPKKTNLKSIKELNAVSDRAEKQKVDHESEDEEEQSDDSEGETKEEKKQDPNSEVESEGEGSESEDEPKWRETDDMEDEAEEEQGDKGAQTENTEDESEEEGNDDKGTEDESEEESEEDKGTETEDKENEAEEESDDGEDTKTEDKEDEAEAEEESNDGEGSKTEDKEKEGNDDQETSLVSEKEEEDEAEESDDDKETRTENKEEDEAEEEGEEAKETTGSENEKEERK